MSISEKLEAARLRAGVWMRERAERAEQKRQASQDPPGVTVPLWLVNAAKFASWVATLSLIYFLWLYTLDIARDRSGPLHITHAGTWVGDIQFWFPYIVGFAIIAFGIPYVAKIAIPTFMSLHWRGNFWPKLWALVIALAVSSVVIMGTFAVQGNTLMERDREAAVAVEQVQQGRAALEAQIESRRQELADMMNNRNAYLAQAASVGAAEWERSYVAQARATNDPRLPMIERALGAARSADATRAELQQLRTQLAQATTVASVQREVVTERTSWVADTLGRLEGIRAILLSLVMDIVALMMPWIALRLEQARNRQLGLKTDVQSSGWASVAERIEDLRDEEPVIPQPMRPAREDIVDAETGERLTRVKPHLRKVKPRKGVPQKVEIRPDPEPDERGVTVDGGQRIGTKDMERVTDLGTVSVNVPGNENASGDDNSARQAKQEEAQTQLTQDEPPSVDELTDEEVAAIEAELAADGQQNDSDAVENASEPNEGDGPLQAHDSSPSENNEQPNHGDGENSAGQETDGDNEEQGEPGFQYAEDETGPVKPRGLIAAE